MRKIIAGLWILGLGACASQPSGRDTASSGGHASLVRSAFEGSYDAVSDFRRCPFARVDLKLVEDAPPADFVGPVIPAQALVVVGHDAEGTSSELSRFPLDAAPVDEELRKVEVAVDDQKLKYVVDVKADGGRQYLEEMLSLERVENSELRLRARRWALDPGVKAVDFRCDLRRQQAENPSSGS